MKTCNRNSDTRVGVALPRRMLGGLGIIAGLALSGHLLAAESSPAGKDYALFVGTDLIVKRTEGSCAVIGADGNAVIIREKDKNRTLPLRGLDGLQYARGVKLSSLVAEVGELKRSFSSQAARQAWFESTRVQVAIQDQANNKIDQSLGNLRNAYFSAGAAGDTRSQAEAAQAMDAANTGLVSGLTDASTLNTVATDLGVKYNLDTVRADADTVETSFAVSSPHPLGPGYVALITEYRVGGKDGVLQHGIDVEDFDRLDAKPRKFRMQQRTPQGAWTFVSQRVAVYAEGQEVATNLSERRTDVTSDEAYQFFLLQYLLAHKGQNRAISTVAMVPRTQLRAAARGVDLPAEIFVRLDPKGTVLSLTTDADGKMPLSPSCATVLEKVRFFPALKNGQPIETRARLAMTDIVR